MRRGGPLLLGALALAAIAPACGTSSQGAPSGTPIATLNVTLKDSLYKPDDIAMKAGDTVTWLWDDGAIAHDVKSAVPDKEPFGSKVQTSGTFTHTFSKAGLFS